jgi:hypothetical protein
VCVRVYLIVCEGNTSTTKRPRSGLGCSAQKERYSVQSL